jgi:hypothetical protein
MDVIVNPCSGQSSTIMYLLVKEKFSSPNSRYLKNQK